MYGEGVKPLKVTGTRWIDHRIRAMGRLVDKVAVHESVRHDFMCDRQDLFSAGHNDQQVFKFQ